MDDQGPGVSNSTVKGALASLLLRSPFARRRCLWAVASPGATDPLKGTKPVEDRVDPRAATAG